jgi:hypothetical protein
MLRLNEFPALWFVPAYVGWLKFVRGIYVWCREYRFPPQCADTGFIKHLRDLSALLGIPLALDGFPHSLAQNWVGIVDLSHGSMQPLPILSWHLLQQSSIGSNPFEQFRG